jgi:hypothetical protein
MKRKFKVRAGYTEFYYAEVEARDGDEAIRKAIMEMDQSDFTEAGDGEWIINNDEEQPEEIKPTMTNLERASAASKAVNSFATDLGMVNEPMNTRIIDLLTDMRHLAAQHDLDFDDLDRSAGCHYEAEINEDE